MVSVVIPVYNAEKYLAESVLSCINQSYSDIEIIMVNDGSIDGSLRVMRQLAEEFHNVSIIDLPHIGKVTAINAGFEQAKGEYIALQAADDVAFPDRFEIQMNMMERDKEIRLVFGDMEVVDEDLRIISYSYWRSQHVRVPQKNHFEELLTHNFVSGGTVLMRAELRHKIFPIPNALEFEDWWIALASSYYGKIVGSNHRFIKYRQHASNSNSMLGRSNMACWVDRQKKLFARNIACYGAFASFVESKVENATLRKRFLNLIEGARVRDSLALGSGSESRVKLLKGYLAHKFELGGIRGFGKLAMYSILGARVFECKYCMLVMGNRLYGLFHN